MDLNFEEYEPEDAIIDEIYNENTNDDDDIGGEDVEDISVDDEIVTDIPIPLLEDVQREVEVTFGPPEIDNVTEKSPHPLVRNIGASRQSGRKKGA